MAVYFIQQVGGIGPIKIGLTSDRSLKLRLHSIQTMCPVRLEIVKAIPGDEDTEKDLHNQFRNIRLHGEWFEPTNQLLDFIASQKALEVPKTIPKTRTARDWERDREQCKGKTIWGARCGNFVSPYLNGYCRLHEWQARLAA